jgi:hypothetical protein
MRPFKLCNFCTRLGSSRVDIFHREEEDVLE